MNRTVLGSSALEPLPVQPLRLGIVGCGYWGTKLVRVFSNLQAVQISVICDRQWQRQRWVIEHYPQIQFMTDYRDLLTSTCEAVVIATPAESHYPIAAACLGAGKHVFVEKPLALCRSQAEQLTLLAQSQNLRLFVGHTFEFDPAIHRIQQIVQSGALGDIYYIDSTRSNLGLLRLDVNVLWDLLIHDVAVLYKILECLPIQVSAVGSCHVTRGKQNICERSQVHMVLPQGIQASAQASWLEPVKTRQLRIIGSQKALVFEPTKTQEIYLYESGINLDTIDEDFDIIYHHGNCHTLHYSDVEPLKIEAIAFINSIRNAETTNAQTAVEIISVLDAMQTSLDNAGKWIAVERVESTQTLGVVS